MSTALRLVLPVYRAAAWLYPPRFRRRYAGQMHLTLRDAMADQSLPPASLASTLLRDLAQSLWKENLDMLKETASRPLLLFNALMLAALATVLALAFYAIPQQVLRQDANDPQLELVGNAALRLQAGIPVAQVISSSPEAQVNVAESLSPFLIAFDEQGHVTASAAQLNGSTIAPPPGVFDYARTHSEERLTWQPQPGVRLATVIHHLPSGGFVLSARNMREIEAREAQMGQMARLLWLAMLAIVALGTFLFGWLRPSPARVHA